MWKPGAPDKVGIYWLATDGNPIPRLVRISSGGVCYFMGISTTQSLIDGKLLTYDGYYTKILKHYEVIIPPGE